MTTDVVRCRHAEPCSSAPPSMCSACSSFSIWGTSRKRLYAAPTRMSNTIPILMSSARPYAVEPSAEKLPQLLPRERGAGHDEQQQAQSRHRREPADHPSGGRRYAAAVLVETVRGPTVADVAPECGGCGRIDGERRDDRSVDRPANPCAHGSDGDGDGGRRGAGHGRGPPSAPECRSQADEATEPDCGRRATCTKSETNDSHLGSAVVLWPQNANDAATVRLP